MARRPSALRHGLSSRYAREQWPESVVELAEAILGDATREPWVREAAREASEAILYLRRVQLCRLAVLEEGALPRVGRTDAERRPALQLSGAVKRASTEDCRALRDELRAAHDAEWMLDLEQTAAISLHLEWAERDDELRRLAEYERRAISRRRSALRRLDYEMIEAERRAPRPS